MSTMHVTVEQAWMPSRGRLDARLLFPAADRRRAVEHRGIALEVARLLGGVQYQTPWRVHWDWSAREREGRPGMERDERRLEVWGPARDIARFVTVVERAVAAVERQATRAARQFGAWRRSLLAQLSGVLEYEDPSTLRVRARVFRRDVLGHLVSALRERPVDTVGVDPCAPLWEQARAVAESVAAEFPVDVWELANDARAEAEELLARLTPVEPSVLGEALAEEPVSTGQEQDLVERRDLEVAVGGGGVPDTVEEFLALAGPVECAPIENTTYRDCSVDYVTNWGEVRAYWRVETSAHLLWSAGLHSVLGGYVTWPGLRALYPIAGFSLSEFAFLTRFQLLTNRHCDFGHAELTEWSPGLLVPV
ncbi:hypothetical protein [Streptomyces alboflavus]|uniref:hypothetical protein n=1 Tax=Streptomyces alboflavus TaxID=67267 RepID=UPI003685ACC5